jgi:hypothetical protein
VGFIASDTIIIILFIYLYLKKKSALVQLINYQCSTFSFRSNSNLIHYKPTVTSLQNYKFVLQVTSICTTSLTQLAYFNASVQISLVSTKISFIYYFLSCVQGYCPSPYVTLSVPHAANAFQDLAKQTIISFVCCSEDFRF